MHKRAFYESNDYPASRAHSWVPLLEAPLPGVACSNSSRDQKRSLGRSADKCGCVCVGCVCGVCVGCVWGVRGVYRGVCAGCWGVVLTRGRVLRWSVGLARSISVPHTGILQSRENVR